MNTVDFCLTLNMILMFRNENLHKNVRYKIKTCVNVLMFMFSFKI